MDEEYLKHINLEVSKEIKDFVKNEVFGQSEYLFFPGSGKEEKAYCSKCNKLFSSKAMELKHNQTGLCPKCSSNTIAKNIRYGKQKLKNEACFYYFEKSIYDSNTIVCKGYSIAKEYKKSYKNPKETYFLKAIYIFDGYESIMLKNEWDVGWVKRISIFNFNTGYMGNCKDFYCSKDNIEDAIKDTKYKYMPVKLIELGYDAVKIFDEYSKYQWIEQLCKLGMIGIVRAKLDKREMYRCLNYRGDNLYKILRISKGDLRAIRKSEIGISTMYLKIYQMQLKEKANLTPEEVKEIEYSCKGNFYKLENILRFMSMKKLSKYLEKQKKVRTIDLIIYDDYLNNCKSLGIDIKQGSVLFPKSLYEMHENLIKQIKLAQNIELDKKIESRIDELNNKYRFEYNGLIIKPATSTEDLIKEGSALNHCVASNYTNAYAKGETIILFIREINDLNKSFYTVEIKDGEVKQVRGNKNIKATEKVEEFIEIYKTKIKIKSRKLNSRVA